MREYTNPPTYTIDDDTCVPDYVFRFADQTPRFVPFRRLVAGAWTDVTAEQFAREVTALAKGLIASGIGHGDRVALMAPTRYEWVALDFAIWTVGGCTVAIYETSSATQVDWILSDSGTRMVIVGSAEHADVARPVTERLEHVAELLQIDPSGSADGAIDVLSARGTELTDADVADRRAAVTADDAATLVYTSGTTGRPKGALLTHRNLLSESEAVRDALGDMMTEGKSTLLFLPMAHIFARAISVGALTSRITVGHSSDLANLVDNFSVFRPTFVLSVPRVFEKVFNTAKQTAVDGGRGGIFEKAEQTAIEWSRAADEGGPGLFLRAKHAVFDKLVYGKLRAALGGECEAAVSGGGPLGERLGHFFRGVGVTIYEGYGLTETTAAVTVNRPGAQRIGSVGQPLSGCAVRIDDDGEVLAEGGVVFNGYWKNDSATAESFTDGWFRTGDLGKLDDDGFLHITGRKKEIIVTAAGKNVAPNDLEDRLRSHPLISQTMIVGDGRPFIAALVTLDPEAVPGWLERAGRPADTPIADLVADADVVAEIDAAVKDANATVSKAEQIKKFRILPTDFTVEGGELTPTLKVKRAVVLSTHERDIEAMYS